MPCSLAWSAPTIKSTLEMQLETRDGTPLLTLVPTKSTLASANVQAVHWHFWLMINPWTCHLQIQIAKWRLEAAGPLCGVWVTRCPRSSKIRVLGAWIASLGMLVHGALWTSHVYQDSFAEKTGPDFNQSHSLRNSRRIWYQNQVAGTLFSHARKPVSRPLAKLLVGKHDTLTSHYRITRWRDSTWNAKSLAGDCRTAHDCKFKPSNPYLSSSSLLNSS